MDLRANTAIDVLIGPFVDDTDGKTAETGLTISQADVRLSKNGQNMAQKNDANAAVHDELGYHNCPLDTTDTNTEGSLVLTVHETGALPVRHEYNVMAEAAWDSLYAAKDTGYMDVNIKAISEDTTAPDNLELMYDGTGYAGGTTKLQTDLTQILAHTLTDTGTQLADGFQTFFDVASPTTHKAITGASLDAAYDAAKTAGTADTGDAMTLQNAAIDNATFAADVGSTAYATNIIGLAVRKALDELRLDELMIAALSAQPTATSLFADLTEDNSGTQRFTAASLANAPSGTGGDATEAKQDAIIAAVVTNAVGTDIAADIIDVKAQIGTAGDGLITVIGANGDTLETLSDQIDGIGAASGGALNYVNEADNVDSAIKTIAFDGTETSGTNVSVNFEDGTYHQITHNSDNIDIVYQFDIGGGRTATEVTWKGDLVGSNDEGTLQVYNGSGWDTIYTIDGTVGAPTSPANNQVITVPLFSTHTLTGADLGKVIIRIECASQSSPVLYTDQLYVSAVNIGQSVGYANGMVWIDSDSGTAGTENFVNGTADNPVASLADALDIAASVGLHDIHVATGSTIVIAEALTNYTIHGFNYTLTPAGYALNNCTLYGAIITGTIATGTGENTFWKCLFGDCSMPVSNQLYCGYGGTMTLSEAGTYIFNDPFSAVAGNASPIFDCTTAGNQNLNFRHASMGIELRNFGATGTDTASIEGDGQIILAASCTSGGNLTVRGNFTITDNASGVVNITDGARYDEQQVRDAMKLAPTAGAGAAGSVDVHLDDIIEDTADLQGNQGAWATATGFATEVKQDLMQTDMDTLVDDQTLPKADYVVVGDTIAGVTTVDTVTTNTDLVSAASIATAVWTEASARTDDFGTLLEQLTDFHLNDLTIADGTGIATLRNKANSADLATWQITDDDTTTTRTDVVW